MQFDGLSDAIGELFRPPYVSMLLGRTQWQTIIIQWKSIKVFEALLEDATKSRLATSRRQNTDRKETTWNT